MLIRHHGRDLSVAAPDPDATVGDLLGALAPGAPPGPLWVDGRRVGPATPLDRAGIHHGAEVRTEPPASPETGADPSAASGLRLRFTTGADAGVSLALGPGLHVVGRRPPAPGPGLQDRTVSAVHARVDVGSGPTPTVTVPNGSSIAMLLEHKGASVLLSADAFPTVLVPALEALAKRRGIAGPMSIDVVKLSHHGSRANVTQDLLRAVDARHFVFSTNNSYFRHPNAEAVARVIVGGSKPTLWFNYDTPSNRQWGAPDLMARHGHVARYPEGDAGVTIELPARRRPRTA